MRKLIKSKQATVLIIILLRSVCVFGQRENYKDSCEFYTKLGKYEQAKYFAEKEIEANKVHGDTSSVYTKAINDFGIIYNKMGNYQEAINLFTKALSLQRSNIHINKLDTAFTLTNMGNSYCYLGKFKEAEAYELEALNIYKENANESETYLNALNNIGYRYICTYENDKSLYYYNQALSLSRKLFGEVSAEYALQLNYIGYVYYVWSRFSEADKYFLNCIEIQKKTVGETHIDYALTLSNQVNMFARMGVYEISEPMLLKVEAIRRATIGIKHPDYASTLNDLGAIYFALRKYKAADSVYSIALGIYKTIYKEDNSDYIILLNNKGRVNELLGNFSVADTLLRLAEKIIHKNGIVLTNTTDYATIMVSLAHLYLSEGKYEKSDSCYKEVIKTAIKDYGVTKKDWFNVNSGLAQLHFIMADFMMAEDFVKRSLISENELLTEKLEFLTQSELINYVNERGKKIDLPYSLLDIYKSPELITAAYNNHLLFSGIALQNTAGLYKQMTHSDDSNLAVLWKNYQDTKVQLTKSLQSTDAKKAITRDSLNNIANLQEKELLRRSSAYRNMQGILNVSWKDIRNHLKPNEASVEFVRFNYFNKRYTDTNYYAAMLIRSFDTVPIFVKLGNEQQLGDALKYYAYKGGSRGIDDNNKIVSLKNNESIYSLIWQPLEAYLANTKTIYFSPDGLLHQVAFAAIPLKKDSLLCDRYNLVQLTSTRQVALQSDNSSLPNSIALFGGVNYNNADTATTTVNPYSYAYQLNRGAGVDSFSYLPNTLKEVSSIGIDMNHINKKVMLYTGNNATEANFRVLGEGVSPDVVHFATHGFTFSGEGKKTNTSNNVFRVSNNPLLRCGLVMAGGNKGWKGERLGDDDDGILTGLEISNVNLTNTRLAVLSACETGLGQLNGSEGVFGLQRAFKIAGVQNVLASLWQVPDKETSIFMETFYNNWLKGRTITQAFIDTQRMMRKKYPPYYWAAFTLVQ